MAQFFACVRFTDNLKEDEFVSCTDIKYHLDDLDHIKPDNVDDFDYQHEYEVLWCLCKTDDCTDEDNKNCLYYKAYIVCLAETVEDVKEKSSTTRFRCPKKIFSPSDQRASQSMPSQSNAQSKNSLDSSTSGFKDNLQIKLDNLCHTRAIEAAKLKAANDQLRIYGQKNFISSRKSFQESSSHFDNRVMKRKTDENKDVSDGTIKRARTSKGKEQLGDKENSYEDLDDNEQFSSIDDDLHNQDPLRDNTPEDVRSDIFDPNDNDPLQDKNENPSRVRREAGRDPFIRKQRRVVRPREVEPVQINPDERAINLYITPEAVEVDARDRQKYQVFDNLIYLGEGKAVNKDFWDFLKLRGDSLFLRETAELICGKQDLVNRCIKEGKTSVILVDHGPRQPIPPNKYFLIRELFQDYMKEREYDKKTRDRLLSSFNRQLGYKIQDLRKALYH